MRFLSTAAGAVGVLAVVSPSAGQFAWDGSCGGEDWHGCCDRPGGMFENNWDVGASMRGCPPFPRAGDSVDLGENDVLIQGTQPGPIEIASLTASGGILVHGQNPMIVNGPFGVNDYFLASGGLTVLAPATVKGNFTWQTAAVLCPLVTVEGTTTFQNFTSSLDVGKLVMQGPCEWKGGDIQLLSGAVIEAQGGMTIETDHNIGGNGGRIKNMGPLVKTAGGVTNLLGVVAFETTGPVTVQQGALGLDGGGSSAATLTADRGATIRFSHGPSKLFTWDSGTTLAGDGAFVMNNFSVIEIPESTVPCSNFRMVNGTIKGLGTFRVDGMFEWLGGVMFDDTGLGITELAGMTQASGFASKVINKRLTINTGSMTMEGTGDLIVELNSEFCNEGRMTIGAGVAINHTGFVGGAFVNKGTVTFEEGGVAFIGIDADNQGVISSERKVTIGSQAVSTGALNMGPGLAMEIAPFSGLVLNPGATISLGEGAFVDVSFNASLTANTDIFIDRLETSGTVKGPATIIVTDALEMQTGPYTGPGRLQALGTVTLGSETLSADIGFTGGTFDSVALASWFRADIEISNGATYNNIGVLTAQHRVQDVTTMHGDGTGVFVNTGTFEKSVESTKVTEIDNVAFFNSSGSVIVRAGTLRFLSQSYCQTGGTLRPVGSGVFIFAAPPAFAGGTVTGAPTPGLFIGDLMNFGARLAPDGDEGDGGGDGDGEAGAPLPPGVFTLTGSFEMGPGGVIEIDLAGTTPGAGHDRFVVTQDATLGGALDVRLAPGYAPIPGDSFEVMAAASITGTFERLALPEAPGLAWEVEYAPDAVVLHVVEAGALGDLDGDGDIDSGDLNILLGDFGCTGGGCPGDVDGDGATDSTDLNLLLGAFGS